MEEYPKVSTKSFTVYDRQWNKVRKLADERFEGKASRAIRHMIDAFRMEADDADPAE